MQAKSYTHIGRQARIIPLLNTKKSLGFEKLVIKGQHQWHILPYDDIIYCHADGNYCQVMTTKNEKILVSRPLKQLILELPINRFLRVHQSYVVSINKIRKISLIRGLTLSDGAEIPMSRRRRKRVLIQLGLQ